MATILKIKPAGRYFRYSVQLKYALSYIVLIVAILIFINIFPVLRFRDMLFEAKFTSMQYQTDVMSSYMSSLTLLRPDEVERVMGLLEDLSITRIIIVDNDMTVVYDSLDNDGNVGKYALFPELAYALAGKNFFHSRYAEGVLVSKSAVPVTYSGNIIGAVYIYDYETEQTALIAALQNDLVGVSFVILFITVVIASVFSVILTGRIRSILRAIKTVRAGRFDYRVKTRGKDELAELVREFNTLVERLQRTEEMRVRFVSDASHELKTPLAGIRLLTDSIIQTEEMDKDTLKEFIMDIGMEAERLTRITERLLDLTRIDRVSPSECTDIDLKTVVEKALKLLAGIAEKKNVSIDVQLADNCLISANTDDIHQVVVNIIDNAIKYNKQDGMVTVLLFSQENKVRLIVDDTGSGIPEEDLPYVFDRFYRVDKARSSEVSGSGLGLAIVRDMVHKHAGTVQVRTREQGGTRFEVVFPTALV